MINKDITKKEWIKPTLTCFGGISERTGSHLPPLDDDDDFTSVGGSLFDHLPKIRKLRELSKLNPLRNGPGHMVS
jgi:hypothetical protein